MSANLAGALDHLELDREAIFRLIKAASDLALLLDGDGSVVSVDISDPTLAKELSAVDTWPGRPWSSCVTSESRPKLDRLLRNASRRDLASRAQLNHPGANGEIPVIYAALSIDGSGKCVALGREMRAISALQQSLIDAQQTLERDYLYAQEAETRYRLLFSVSAEPLMVIDAATYTIVEVNPAGLRFLEVETKSARGKSFFDFLAADSRVVVRAFLAQAYQGGRDRDIRIELRDRHRQAMLFATFLRQANTALLLLRIRPLDGVDQSAAAEEQALLSDAFRHATDALVVADPQGRIVVANPAFVDLVQLNAEQDCAGRQLDEWLGRAGIDVAMLISSVRQRGPIRLFATSLRGELGSELEVEVAATAFGSGSDQRFSFAIRNVSRRLSTETAPPSRLPHSVEQMSELIGRASLKEISREATELVEKLAVEAALRLTNDNKASAAELLGISRQSLYVKMRLFGIGGSEADRDRKG